MSHRTLIAYASRAGSTAEVAQTIGDVLREHGHDVDLRSVYDVGDVAGYDSLVLGTAIWAGKPLPEMRRFMTAHRDALAGLPVAYFIQCDLLRKYTPANRQIALGYLAPLRALKEPVSIGLFAGRRDFSTTNRLLRWFLMRVVRLAEGDWRNWDQIRAWAARLAEQLVRSEVSLQASSAA
jgi:menaquinone-dependent protoporphyrinogen oxidase